MTADGGGDIRVVVRATSFSYSMPYREFPNVYDGRLTHFWASELYETKNIVS